MITSLNLFFGCMAIVEALQGNLSLAFLYMILSAIFDFCDGFAARLLNAYSDMGKELDSIADVVSFGVVPSCFLYYMGCGEYGFIVAVFSALRLAKFNVDTRQTTQFIGLPTPANALFFCSIGYVVYTMPELAISAIFSSAWFLYPAIGVFSLLLVSEIPMFSLKFKSYGLKANLKVYLFLVLTVGAIAYFHILAIPFVILGYVLLSTVEYLYFKISNK